MSFRNRCLLSGPNGTIGLSVPLAGGRNQRVLTRDLRIDNRDKWQSRHWKTITSCYNKSPYLDFYRDELEQLYRRPAEFLMDWNLRCFEWACDKLALKTNYSLTDEYRPEYPGEGMADWRNRLLPATINREFPEARRYPQVFEDRFGFTPNLSVLDYLLCTGGRIR